MVDCYDWFWVWVYVVSFDDFFVKCCVCCVYVGGCEVWGSGLEDGQGPF